MSATGFAGWARGIRQAGLVALVGTACVAGAAAPNDSFFNAGVLSGLTNFTVSNVGATSEPGEPPHAGEPAARSLWWRWTPPFAGSFSIVTSNSFVTNRVALDTTLAVYTGNTLAALVPVVANDDTYYGEFGATWSRLVFRAYPTETLWIAVDSIGAAGSIRLEISVAGPITQPWTVTNLQGQLVASSNYAGQVIMVDFWETTCGACVEEFPDLVRVQDALHPRGFSFFGISGDTGPDPVNYYLHSHAVNYPIAMGNPQAQSILAGGPVGYPTKFLIDREGRTVGQYLGGHDEAYYRGLIEPLLRTAPPLRVNIFSLGAAGVRVSWPGVEPGYHVETTADPASNTWVDLGLPVVLMNNQYFVTIPPSNPPRSAQFLRLAKP
ncbi:MAG: hypothetical protein QOF48_3123 [Verrucomicrobiota bacterium]|jgi:thiol-disulfide isomerase/thioredoxin